MRQVRPRQWHDEGSQSRRHHVGPWALYRSCCISLRTIQVWARATQLGDLAHCLLKDLSYLATSSQRPECQMSRPAMPKMYCRERERERESDGTGILIYSRGKSSTCTKGHPFTERERESERARERVPYVPKCACTLQVQPRKDGRCLPPKLNFRAFPFRGTIARFGRSSRVSPLTLL